MRFAQSRLLPIGLAAAVLAGLSATSFAQAPAEPSAAERNPMDRMTVWDLELGTPVAEMPEFLAFKDYACGSDGGPPRQPLTGWQDFAMCPPDPTTGLYEVYFEYDDEAEYVLRAHNDQRAILVTGTTDKSFPIATSALFDAGGTLRGLRIVTDPRADYTSDTFFDLGTMRVREDHHLLGPFLASQFQINSGIDCIEIPLAADEESIGGSYTKLDCERIDEQDHVRYILQTRYLRKPGQLGRDPITGALTEGQFESWTRAEIYQEGYGPEGSVLDNADGTAPIPTR